MKAVAILPLLAMCLAPAVVSADPGSVKPPHMLSSGAMLCKSPEAYQSANGSDASRADALDSNQCMRITEDDLEEMLAPFVEILDQRGSMILVQYSVEYEDKIELLHRKVAHVRFTGWTDEGNLRNYHEWLTGKPQT